MSAQGPHIPLLLCETITLRMKPYNARPQFGCTGIRMHAVWVTQCRAIPHTRGQCQLAGSYNVSRHSNNVLGAETMPEWNRCWLRPRQWDASSTEGTDVRQGRRLLIVLVRGKVTCAKVWVLAGIVCSGQLMDFCLKHFSRQRNLGTTTLFDVYDPDLCLTVHKESACKCCGAFVQWWQTKIGE